MNDNASYVMQTSNLDDDAIDAYQLIQSSLKQIKEKEDFMDIVTTTLFYGPNLIKLENILYIIDDKKSRHPNLFKTSGRELLKVELNILEKLVENIEIVPDFYFNKFGWDVDECNSDDSGLDSDDSSNPMYSPDELTEIFLLINHAYNLCYWLRDYVSTTNQLFAEFQKKLSIIKANTTTTTNEPDY